MSKVRIILRMFTQGESKSNISERTGTSRNTVKKYIRDFISLGVSIEEINALNDSELDTLFVHEDQKKTDPRYQAMLDFFPQVEKAVKTKGMTRDRQWFVYNQANPDGYCRSQFHVHYKRWLNKPKSVMHIEHKAGDKMYVDYAGSKLEFINPCTGEICVAEVFVSILGASQLAYVEATMTQKKEDFIASCENSLHYFGGAPQAIITDNLKSAVTKSNKYEPTLNELFKDFAEYYGMTVLPAKPYRPTYKALVEGMVKIMYRTVYLSVKEKTHNSLEELNQSIREALEVLNNQMLSARPYSRRQLFEETEKSSLQVLPLYRYEARRKHVVKVQKNGHVRLGEDKHYYSVPYHYIDRKAIILYSQTKVDIYIGYELVAGHQRDQRPYRYTTVEDHMASNHRYASDWTPEKFIERASEVGESTKEMIIKILELKQHPEQAYKSCQGILSYVPKVGKSRLENACIRALYYKEYSYQTIRTIIEKGLDKEKIDTESELRIIPPHDNIRGNMYFK
jgi:transposase